MSALPIGCSVFDRQNYNAVRMIIINTILNFDWQGHALRVSRPSVLLHIFSRTSAKAEHDLSSLYGMFLYVE